MHDIIPAGFHEILDEHAMLRALGRNTIGFGDHT